MKKTVLILGASHTGIALSKKIKADPNFECVLSDTFSCPDAEVSDIYSRFGKDISTYLYKSFNTYFVVHDEDGVNVRLILLIKAKFKDARIFTVLSQTNLATKLGKHIRNVEYVNQAALASKKFVDSIYETDDKSPAEPDQKLFQFPKFRMDPLIKKALIFIGCVMVVSASFFHFYDKIPWIDSFYFTVTMMTTVGFGDFSLRDHDNVSKIFGTFIMIMSVVGFALGFALINDTIIRKRWELTHGITKYKGKDHVIVVGGGSVGHRVIKDLQARGEKPVLIDKKISGRYLQDILASKVPFIIGDATNEKFLLDANVAECKAVVAVTQDDLTNLEIGLDTKNMHPERRVVLRIYDQKLSVSLKDNHIIKHSYSMSYIAADYFMNKLKNEN
jgi:hypothetical protein